MDLPVRDDHELVSVVTPFYNAERFLAETIESVLAQTYASWELLLVDDGSDDGSATIARHYAGRDPARIRLLGHEGERRRGASATRNVALAAARGDYVAFLDADDIWLPEKLAYQTAALNRVPGVGMVYGPTEEWYSWSGRMEDRARDMVPPLRVPLGEPLPPPGPLPVHVRRRAPSPCTCGVLVRTDIARAVGGFEESFTELYTDQVFYAKICLAAPVLALDRSFDRYRRHPDSCYSRAKSSGRAAVHRLAYLEWLEQYLSQHDARYPTVERAVRRELLPYRHPWLAGMLGHAASIRTGLMRRFPRRAV